MGSGRLRVWRGGSVGREEDIEGSQRKRVESNEEINDHLGLGKARLICLKMKIVMEKETRKMEGWEVKEKTANGGGLYTPKSGELKMNVRVVGERPWLEFKSIVRKAK